MLNARSRRLVARASLALMLFAQGAMAWSACALPERAPELALRAAVDHQGCEQMQEEASTASVCFAHTLADKQSLYKASLELPDPPSNPMALVAPPAMGSGSSIDPGRTEPASTGPPRRILLQSFQV